MLAVAVDGNRKLYRFKSQPGPCGFFHKCFLAKDAEVSSFVDYIHATTRHNPAKGRCGSGQWSAARETANNSKYMSKAVRTDMLTIQASGWNKRKAANLEKTLAKRYMKCKGLQKQQRIWRNSQLNCHYRTTKQWTTGTPIQNDLQKTIEGLYLSIKRRKYQLYRKSGGNKRRHKLRKKIVEEKKALEDAITEHNAVAGEADKLPPPNELLAEDNYSWKWECHGDMVQKKKVYDKLSEGITGQSSTEALTERGREGLLCVRKKQLHKVKAQQAMARIAYQCILGQQTVSLDDSSEEQPADSSSSTDEEL
ncbi:hypothetical protein CesoFtcFv8_001705 [Champsocephalus esox]|uniref:Uncharacterized protein n=1 Tax=Champsocephalus esox TaxID=159716 RepID=A0AAN8HDL9_9TELE|nr:hypothetical protein CesoFtcFv8_001705 [Champsocephalus esox]